MNMERSPYQLKSIQTNSPRLATIRMNHDVASRCDSKLKINTLELSLVENPLTYEIG